MHDRTVGVSTRPAACTRLVTIGVYGYHATSFLAALRRAEVEVLLDVRQRRGVRGSAYAWANARRLQAALAAADIAYAHHRELAPTTEMRQLQYAEDDRQGVGTRSRTQLADAYVQRYTSEVLDDADLDLAGRVLVEGWAAALLCVEATAAACHRSLVAARLAERHDVELVHLLPGSDEADAS